MAAFERLGYQPSDSYVLMAKRLTKTSEELVTETAGVTVATN